MSGVATGSGDYDVVVAGGGPAGSTAAAFLAKAGHRVCLIDKAAHPRFHIGESLLPWNMPILKRLGILPDIEKLGVLKRAADFTTPDSDCYERFDFSQAMRGTPPTAFQVRRSEFDAALFRHAGRQGADLMENTRIRDIDFSDPAAVVVTADGPDGNEVRLSSRFVVDASGRDTLLSRAQGWKRRHPTHRSAAAYGHFRGVARRPAPDEGNISIYWFHAGWIWMIPLSDGSMSVGVVAPPAWFAREEAGAGAADTAFHAGIAASPPAAARMADAEPVNGLQATGNFSYFSDHMHGDRHLLVGDAFAFVDPVFSSGVYVAMSTAEAGAKAVDTWLEDRAAGERAFAALERRTRRGINRLWWLIGRFNTPPLRHMFMNPRDTGGMRAALLAILAGDIYGNRRLWLPFTLFKLSYRGLALAVALGAKLRNGHPAAPADASRDARRRRQPSGGTAPLVENAVPREHVSS